ncbi:MAG: GatB/YqeY domain-containing protein [Bacteroidia bacterium]|nr:GatB/YqeY domain-containing protein [Bacteroidia bacterium]
MNLTEKINNDIKAAMLAKEQPKLLALRAVKAELILVKTSGSNVEISEEMELKILQKLVKQRRESAEIYKQQGRMDLFQQEDFEATVIESYLPSRLSDEQVTDIIKKIISEVGATSPRDMGKVMGAAYRQLAGKTDNKLIAEKVKILLSA